MMIKTITDTDTDRQTDTHAHQGKHAYERSV